MGETKRRPIHSHSKNINKKFKSEKSKNMEDNADFKNKKNRTNGNKKSTKVKIVSKSDKIKRNKKDGDNLKEKPKKKSHKILKALLIIILLLIIIGSAILAAVFFGLFGDDFKIKKEDLIIDKMTTVVKSAKTGDIIANLATDENRKIITLSDMPAYLPKAFVSIEDERFYQHHGVDIKRTLGATAQYIIHRGSSSYGGSTITQQLVKNLTMDKDNKGAAGMLRKVKEMAKAYQIENMISKDQILELYLNLIFLGDQTYGVEIASQYYFNKSAKDLDLAQCAFLAGINNSPNAYRPFDTNNQTMQDKIKTRTKTVLKKMKDLGNITNEDDYKKAVEEVDNGLAFDKGTIVTNATNYSYHTMALINQVKQDLMEENKWSSEMADIQLRTKGYVIYSTEDPDIQSKLETEYANSKKYQITGTTKDGTKVKSQSAMVIIDHKTGQVVGTVGGLGTEVDASGLNRATQSRRQPGSTIKPLAVIAPGLENKVITAGTVYYDNKTTFPGNYNPKNDNERYLDAITIRQAIESSQNIPELKAMSDIGPANSIKFMREMGISSLVTAKEAKEQGKKASDENLALAIGGITNGISPLEMAAAYATIANGGEYIEPTFYTKVEDKYGKTVLEVKQEKRRVMSEQNAYIEKSILTAPVVGISGEEKFRGTAPYCKIDGMDVAAKTGTTDDNRDRWLCGFTPYYTAATWYGYDENIEVNATGTNPAGKLWSAVMKDIHTGLDKAKFEQPDGIVTKKIATANGLLATANSGEAYNEIFVSGTEPKDSFKGGKSVKICVESGLLATKYCPETETKYYGAAPAKEVQGEKSKRWHTDGKSTSGNAPTDYCTIHTGPVANNTNNTNTNTSNDKNNTSGGAGKDPNNKITNSNANTNTNTNATGNTNTHTNTNKPGANTNTNTGGSEVAPESDE